MDNQKKLELTLCGMLPYKLQLHTDYNFRPNSKEKPLIKGAKATLTGDLYADIENKTFGKNPFKPLLHSIDKLTKEIEHNGEKFFPLEVIGKIIDKDYTLLHFDGEDVIIGKDINPRCGHPYDCDCTEYTHDLFYKDFNFYSTIYQDGNPNNIIGEDVFESYLLIEKLKEWHFNIYDLPKEMYIEKSEVK